MPLNNFRKIFFMFLTCLILYPLTLSALTSVSQTEDGDEQTSDGSSPPAINDESGVPEILVDAKGDKYVFDPRTQKTYRIDSIDESTRELAARITGLESSKQDLSIWITIFVTSVILIIGINIGLSVWQVGSIARREAEDYMKEYEKHFQNVINETIAQIDDKISNYEINLNELASRINELGPKFESSIEKSEDAISSLASFAEKILKEFKEETQKTKSSIIDDMEKWQEKKIRRLSPPASD